MSLIHEIIDNKSISILNLQSIILNIKKYFSINNKIHYNKVGTYYV